SRMAELAAAAVEAESPVAAQPEAFRADRRRHAVRFGPARVFQPTFCGRSREPGAGGIMAYGGLLDRPGPRGPRANHRDLAQPVRARADVCPGEHAWAAEGREARAAGRGGPEVRGRRDAVHLAQ